ncbi:MAG: NupC/NupG family nucleoside CNT transporter, partial [Xanthomonadaceae bacterium]|nr:NupC/NupG family nucleoside CNT transporter [Xanthomonadaceae bacterium]
MHGFIGLLGIIVLLGIAWLASEHRRHIQWQTILVGLGLQLSLAMFVLWVPFGKTVFETLGSGFVKLVGFTQAGSSFIFGDLANAGESGFIIAFQVLPTIIFFASLMACLYHIGIMQKLVEVMAWVMTRFMKVSGSESLATAANSFVGQTEAPLVVKPFIAGMTRSE